MKSEKNSKSANIFSGIVYTECAVSLCSILEWLRVSIVT